MAKRKAPRIGREALARTQIHPLQLRIIELYATGAELTLVDRARRPDRRSSSRAAAWMSPRGAARRARQPAEPQPCRARATGNVRLAVFMLIGAVVLTASLILQALIDSPLPASIAVAVVVVIVFASLLASIDHLRRPSE